MNCTNCNRQIAQQKPLISDVKFSYTNNGVLITPMNDGLKLVFCSETCMLEYTKQSINVIMRRLAELEMIQLDR